MKDNTQKNNQTFRINISQNYLKKYLSIYIMENFTAYLEQQKLATTTIKNHIRNLAK